MSTQLDPGQAVKDAYDESNHAHKVNVVAGSASFSIDSELVDNTAYTPNTSSTLVIAAEVDDVAPVTVTEGNAGALRMSSDRSLHSEIRDSAGNNRGANVTASNELKVISSAQPGVDIGDVTINNAAGGAAVNIQDGGNSITVDAVSLPLPTGAATEATISARLSGSLVPTAFDQIDLTYVTVGNGVGQIETAVYKLSAGIVKTLTLSYNGDNKLSSVVAS